MLFKAEGSRLICRHQGEFMVIEPWGRDSLRLRATRLKETDAEAWALTEPIEPQNSQIEFFEETFPGEARGESAAITNGRIRCVVNFAGVLRFYKDGKQILREYQRFYGGAISRSSRCLKIENREWRGVTGADRFSLTWRLEPNEGEKLFGMGQYQDGRFDLKGSVLELAQRNSQSSVPFVMSSLGYALLWNNPAVGNVTFGNNMTVWTARATRQMDIWITVADTPRRILASYTAVTGRAPEFPEELMGLWQCKLRYRTQEEVLSVARKYAAEGIHIDQIVIDFFHWPYQGDWKFDKTYWPDPKAMVDELHAMGIRVIVSVWPSVDRRSENYYPMWEKGLLIRTERGEPETYDYQGDCCQVDAFNPEARAYIWEKCKQNYYDLGIDGFWLDNSEPDLGVYDFDNIRYCDGPALSITNQYPQMFSRAFYEPMRREGRGQPVNLLRCGWAGSQKYGNVLWSGDVPSTFEAFSDQLKAGLNMGIAGIPWWTTDIGGFMTDDVKDPYFRELLVRWYQFAVYSAVLRMHGDRGPYDIPPLDERDWGGGYLHTGQNNELWSYGEEIYAILKDYYRVRIEMHDYIKRLYDEAAADGSPLIRPMFYEFPQDEKCWEICDQYMFGDKYLVAPLFSCGAREREVYLPEGVWRLTSDKTVCRGGRTVKAAAPLAYMPVFEKI